MPGIRSAPEKQPHPQLSPRRPTYSSLLRLAMAHANAVAVLVTSDSYLPGALVVLHSLIDVEPEPRLFTAVCLVLPSLLPSTIAALSDAFDELVFVETIHSQDTANLGLLGRPDLTASLTKLHLFRLVQFRKIIYLDADTLVIQPLSPLFGLIDDFAAAPDIGWPDCFNSGLMVLRPKIEWYNELVEMATRRGSTWDGADQGLLNDFFSGHYTSSSLSTSSTSPPTWRRLSYTYNVTPNPFYSSIPAYQRFRSDISMFHFIGPKKPWNEPPCSSSSTVPHTSNQHTSSMDSTPPNNVYATLENHWHNVCQRHRVPLPDMPAQVPRSSSLSNDPALQANITVPDYVSAWDPDSQLHQDSYRPPSPQFLTTKEYFPIPLEKLDNIQRYEPFLQKHQPTHLIQETPKTANTQLESMVPSSQTSATTPLHSQASPQKAFKFPWEDTSPTPTRTFPEIGSSSSFSPITAPRSFSLPGTDHVRTSEPSLEAHTPVPVTRTQSELSPPVSFKFPWEDGGRGTAATRVFHDDTMPQNIPQNVGKKISEISLSKSSPSNEFLTKKYLNVWDDVPGIQYFVDKFTQDTDTDPDNIKDHQHHNLPKNTHTTQVSSKGEPLYPPKSSNAPTESKKKSGRKGGHGKGRMLPGYVSPPSGSGSSLPTTPHHSSSDEGGDEKEPGLSMAFSRRLKKGHHHSKSKERLKGSSSTNTTSTSRPQLPSRVSTARARSPRSSGLSLSQQASPTREMEEHSLSSKSSQHTAFRRRHEPFALSFPSNLRHKQSINDDKDNNNADNKNTAESNRQQPQIQPLAEGSARPGRIFSSSTELAKVREQGIENFHQFYKTEDAKDAS